MSAALTLLTWGLVAAPALALVTIGTSLLLGIAVGERALGRITLSAIATSLLAATGLVVVAFLDPNGRTSVELGRWVSLPGAGYALEFAFVFDHLALVFLMLSLVLSGVVGSFVRSYLHREEGYGRFQLLYLVFVLGMILSSIAGTIETLFVGWEMVGLSSALLVGFYQERPEPVRNGLRVWSVYRFADAAFLIGAVALHHHLQGVATAGHASGSIWTDGLAALSPQQATVVGAFLLVAAAGKSALLPFSGWLPRAMEGPTPSSAIFYGALSVHLGAFLLLRVGTLFELSTTLSMVTVALGLGTAVYAGASARVQTDIKGALACASLTQVGLIVAEIGLGLPTLALLHICGNACLRTLQLLRAPSLLHDYHQLVVAIGDDLPSGQDVAPASRWARLDASLYAVGFERGLFDHILVRVAVRPFIATFRKLDAWEGTWTRWLGGRKTTPGASLGASAVPLDCGEEPR